MPEMSIVMSVNALFCISDYATCDTCHTTCMVAEPGLYLGFPSHTQVKAFKLGFAPRSRALDVG